MNILSNPKSEILGHVKHLLLAFTFLCCFLFSAMAFSHPADELCFEEAMDVLLCAELAELDRSTTTSTNTNLPAINLDRSSFATFSLYTRFGIEHILPFGLDHLAFLLALIISATALRSLLIQISVFTLAHSLTLVLGVMQLITLNALLVEVIIALSIVFVAFENLFVKYRLAWRSVIVFVFGLLHGLGFADALSDMGLSDDHFVSGLIGFNIGVEIGQLLFGLVFFVVLHKLIKPHQFKRFIFVPGNCLIAIAGLYWLIERIV